MTIDELTSKDKKFNESMFLTKVNNVFIKYFSSIMFEEMDEVKHFISDDIYNEGLAKIKKLQDQGLRQMYDELNVKDSKIGFITEDQGFYIIKVFVTGRYMDYLINRDSGDTVSGIDDRRIEEHYTLEFKKKKDYLEQGSARKCPGCGAPMDINNSGKCEYCGATYNLEDYDYILTSIIKG